MTTYESHLGVTETGPAPEQLGKSFNTHLQGVALANLADGIVLGAVPLVAITLTQSPGEISLIQTAFWLPWLLFGVLAGIVVDRFDRRHIQLAGTAVRAILLASIALVALTGSLTMPLLIGTVAIYGITQVFVDLAGSSIVPQLAPRSRLAAANGRIMGMQQVCTSFIGAPLGGAILVLGSGWVFGVPAALGVLFLLVIGMQLRGDFRAVSTAAVTESRPSRMQEVMEGISFQMRHPVLRPLLLNGSILNFANTAYFAVFVLWVVGPDSAVKLEPHQFPLLTAVLAVGAIGGSLVAEHMVARLPEIPLVLGFGLLNSLLLAVPVFWPGIWPIAIAFFIIGLTNIVGNVVRRSISQRLIPADKLGRVGGASGMINYGLMPVGALLGGIIGERFDLPTLFISAVIVMIVSSLWIFTQVNTGTVRAHELAAPDPLAAS